jgi:hypothetical protein
MKRVVILILTLTFLAVLYYAYTTTADSSVDVTKKEGFTSASPTRASDCNCLPGYIPSKKSSGETFFCQRLGDPSARRECY